MGKRGKSQKIGNQNPKKAKLSGNGGLEDMNDEIDIFHKQRDKIPIDINDDNEDTDEDDELPVFDYKGIVEDDDDDGGSSDEDEEEDDDPDLLVRKIKRTQNFLKAKHGNLEDDVVEDAEDEKTEPSGWGRKKSLYYNADNTDIERQSSDEDSAQEEEAEVIRLRKEAAKSMTAEDVGIEEDENDESDREPTIEELLGKEKDASWTSEKNENEDIHVPFEKVTKDLSSLSRDEQMDVVYSSAPELVGLLSELNDAFEQLENSVNPALSKVPSHPVKEGLLYLEVKKQVLLTYSQAIAFYLLLKSEGQLVRDHPVIARLVEIKGLLDKIKELDANFPSHLEELLEENKDMTVAMPAVKNSTVFSNLVSEMKHRQQMAAPEAEASKLALLQKMEISKEIVPNTDNNQARNKKSVSSQSAKMLSKRAALEEKLKQKGVFTIIEPINQGIKKQKMQPLNKKLETSDDFDDDAMDAEEVPLMSYGKTQSLANRVSHYLTAKGNKTKVSGDEDLPERDDLGEKRRKFELLVLARAGIKSRDKDDGSDDHDGAEPASGNDDGNDSADVEGAETDGSEDEFYRQVKQQRNQRLAVKAMKYSRDPVVPSAPELPVDGKRHITTQIEKNRGLTRHRKKLIKNPRKKYKLKHDKAKKRHEGQVRKIVKPDGPYGGEKTGINIRTSRSIRLAG